MACRIHLERLKLIFAKDNGSGVYNFLTTENSDEIPVHEGEEKTKTFISGETEERQVFVIPR